MLIRVLPFTIGIERDLTSRHHPEICERRSEVGPRAAPRAARRAHRPSGSRRSLSRCPGFPLLSGSCTLRDFHTHEIAVYSGISGVRAFLGGLGGPLKRYGTVT